jgi:hypothetical protein
MQNVPLEMRTVGLSGRGDNTQDKFVCGIGDRQKIVILKVEVFYLSLYIQIVMNETGIRPIICIGWVL